MIKTMPTMERNEDNTFNILVFGVVVERNVPVMQLAERMKAHWPEQPAPKTRKGRKAA